MSPLIFVRAADIRPVEIQDLLPADVRLRTHKKEYLRKKLRREISDGYPWTSVIRTNDSHNAYPLPS
ncbi:hypothetical protein L210DRAFT_3523285 [Boletus edulis BED1]|uniref:Uncharacterized protein n=1 Tax=Boletus edulis BED1 TaxID=1328754 RepID=A0AAD4C5Y5_BOLED|nr:hypothetical protein L210DRAFT_3523285 [Boletus edulis BED1]